MYVISLDIHTVLWSITSWPSTSLRYVLTRAAHSTSISILVEVVEESLSISFVPKLQYIAASNDLGADSLLADRIIFTDYSRF